MSIYKYAFVGRVTLIAGTKKLIGSLEIFKILNNI